MERLLEYKNKCKVMKQIQSNRSLKYKRINGIMVFITVVISGAITFIGFSGTEKIQLYINFFFGSNIPETVIQFVSNLGVFLLFLISVLNIIFNSNKKQYEADMAISSFSSLINKIDDMIEIGEESSYKEIASQYSTLTQNTANTDREYKNAIKKINKKAYDKKKIEKKNKTYKFEDLAFSKKEKQEEYIKDWLDKDEKIQQILEAIHQNEPQGVKLFLGGGVVRNLIWDKMMNYSIITQNKDVDVIYFDNNHKDKMDDISIQNSLSSCIPNIVWSVKNQARMNECNDDDPYTSLEDAIQKWPERASAILVRKDKFGEYEFVAPFGYDDLFRMIVRPTPRFKLKIDKYRERVKKHDWQKRWEKLVIMDMDD